MIPLFSTTFNTKYRAENFTNTDSDTNTNAYRHMVAINSQLLLCKYIYKGVTGIQGKREWKTGTRKNLSYSLDSLPVKFTELC